MSPSYILKAIAIEKKLLYYPGIKMAKLYAESNWTIKVLNGEHVPVHVHVDGMAVVAHEVEIRTEWLRLDNPEDRG